MDIAYDTGKIVFSFLHTLIDRAHALFVAISSLEIDEKTKEANVRLEFDTSQMDTILLHLELRKQLPGFLQNHQSLVTVMRKIGEEPTTWLARTQFAEALQLLSPAPDRFTDDPSGSVSLTYYVVTTVLLNTFLRSNGFDLKALFPLEAVPKPKKTDLLSLL